MEIKIYFEGSLGSSCHGWAVWSPYFFCVLMMHTWSYPCVVFPAYMRMSAKSLKLRNDFLLDVSLILYEYYVIIVSYWKSNLLGIILLFLCVWLTFCAFCKICFIRCLFSRMCNCFPIIGERILVLCLVLSCVLIWSSSRHLALFVRPEGFFFFFFFFFAQLYIFGFVCLFVVVVVVFDDFLYCFDLQRFLSDHLWNLFLVIVLIIFSNHSNLALICQFFLMILLQFLQSPFFSAAKNVYLTSVGEYYAFIITNISMYVSWIYIGIKVLFVMLLFVL